MQTNGKLKIYIDFIKLNVATKKDPYPLPFIHEMFNIVTWYETYIFLDPFRISSNLYSCKGQIQDCSCYKLRGFIWKVMLFGV